MLGSHLSIAGAMVNALHEAHRLKFETVQVFTKNQRQWRVPALKDEARDEWLAELGRLGWEGRTVSHASYLANLASPDPALWEKSVVMMRAELDRCEALSIPFLVFHPGAHVGAGDEDAHAGMARIARAIARLLDETKGSKVSLCLENTAGSGTTLGRSFEELAEISAGAKRLLGKRNGRDACSTGKMRERKAGRDACPTGRDDAKAGRDACPTGRDDAKAGRDACPTKKAEGEGSRIGFCLDTCHMLAAGHDITTEAGVERVFGEFDRLLGLDRLRVLHLNDSKGALGSRIDRHTHIGDGAVGRAAFAHLMNRPKFRDVPKILETPKGETPKGTPWDTINRRRLFRLIAKRDGRG